MNLEIYDQQQLIQGPGVPEKRTPFPNYEIQQHPDPRDDSKYKASSSPYGGKFDSAAYQMRMNGMDIKDQPDASPQKQGSGKKENMNQSQER